MSTETLSMRDYRLTDNELITFTHSLSMAMTRDLTELANYGVTAAKIVAGSAPSATTTGKGLPGFCS